MSQGLPSLFRVLRARRAVFTDPACQVKTASPDPTIGSGSVQVTTRAFHLETILSCNNMLRSR